MNEVPADVLIQTLAETLKKEDVIVEYEATPSFKNMEYFINTVL